MTAREVAHVVVAAGGLGTRVQPWSRFLPKEFYPVDGRPGIVHLLTEIAALQPVKVVIVYHPYYEPFITWAKHVLHPGAIARYQPGNSLVISEPAIPEVALEFIPQRGPYADVTSVLNGAARLPTGPLFLAFADNLYPGSAPLLDLAAIAPGTVAVLGRPFDLNESAHRGVIICHTTGGQLTMAGLVEKPSLAQAAGLIGKYGIDNLRLLEGRARLTAGFITHLKTTTTPPGATRVEPKLSRTLAHYSRRHKVEVITTTASITDLGAPR